MYPRFPPLEIIPGPLSLQPAVPPTNGYDWKCPGSSSSGTDTSCLRLDHVPAGVLHSPSEASEGQCELGVTTENGYTDWTNSEMTDRMANQTEFTSRKQLEDHSETHKKHHNPGSVNAVMNLVNVDDIEKWKEERRKNYPTSQNVAKRQTELHDKTVRGEVLQTKQFGKFRRRQHEQRQIQGQTQPFKHPGRSTTAAKPQLSVQQQKDFNRPEQASLTARRTKRRPARKPRERIPKDKQVHQEATKRRLNKFGGANCVAMRDTEQKDDTDVADVRGHPITDSEDESTERHLSNESPAREIVIPNANFSRPGGELERASSSVPSALKNLMSAYQSETEPEELPLGSPRVAEVQEQPCAPQQMPARTEHISPKKFTQTPSKKRRVTLLEMLLAKEIRHERNVILQCVRHIVKNDFFGIQPDI